MFSSSSTAAALSGHWQCQQSYPCLPCPPPAEEDFSVDDLLDLGDGKELTSDMEDFLEAGDVADLEWVSRFVDDSYSEFPAAVAPFPAASKTEAPPKPQVAGANASWKRTWGSCCFSTDTLVVPAKARSKRSRSGGRVWSFCRPPFFTESSSSSCSSGSSSSSCSASSTISSCLLHENLTGSGGGGGGNPDLFPDSVSGRPLLLTLEQHPPQQLQLPVKKKKGRKPKALTGAAAAGDGGAAGELPQTRRRCTHCGVDKTPQWRAGPMGAKTLCNACGVRYKSGRLLPEYRPAGSPTFVSHIHSNSHRKVLEMRRKKEIIDAPAAVTGGAACSPLPPLLTVAPQPYGVV
ncbi:unnamed protein product [Spirodela intermedia]|uniref:GATA-type domain-containing protein n=1 Tax=Spirodela intermedia TaxID=51605 RepID=A0A7I8IHQ8_SPIIN|nr:unnamed protein product [Spirodela intermedia]CAA6656392.1 unnamed protein product [Spirodela intermedia]